MIVGLVGLKFRVIGQGQFVCATYVYTAAFSILIYVRAATTCDPEKCSA